MIQLAEIICVFLIVGLSGYIILNKQYLPNKEPNTKLTGLILVAACAIVFFTLGKFIPSIQIIESSETSLLICLLVAIIESIAVLRIYNNKNLKNESA